MKFNVKLINSADKDLDYYRAYEFEREVVALGSSDKFMSFLEERSKEKRDIPIEEAAKKRGIKSL
jgi:hypothetical protein